MPVLPRGSPRRVPARLRDKAPIRRCAAGIAGDVRSPRSRARRHQVADSCASSANNRDGSGQDCSCRTPCILSLIGLNSPPFLAVERVVADILINCTVFGMMVPTGIATEMIILDTLDFELAMYCPACRQVHRWKRADAWVDQRDVARSSVWQ